MDRCHGNDTRSHSPSPPSPLLPPLLSPSLSYLCMRRTGNIRTSLPTLLWLVLFVLVWKLEWKWKQSVANAKKTVEFIITWVVYCWKSWKLRHFTQSPGVCLETGVHKTWKRQEIRICEIVWHPKVGVNYIRGKTQHHTMTTQHMSPLIVTNSIFLCIFWDYRGWLFS